jgi:hypothetical protein
MAIYVGMNYPTSWVVEQLSTSQNLKVNKNGKEDKSYLWLFLYLDIFYSGTPISYIILDNKYHIWLFSTDTYHIKL